MSGRIIKEKQDLTFLKWSLVKSSGSTGGKQIKSESKLNDEKTYYKLSNFDPVNGVVGHECVNEMIVDRLLTLFEVDHLSYDLIHADIEIEGRTYETYLCASGDFKMRGESKVPLDDFYRTNAFPGESHYDFCVRNGWKDYIDTMIAIDFIILNRDRHGANIEVLRNPRAKTLRIAPLFDHGLSLLYSCTSDKEAKSFDIMEDRKCQNFIGGFSTRENLKMLSGRKDLLARKLKKADKQYLFDGLDDILSQVFIEKIWDMIFERYKIYENL